MTETERWLAVIRRDRQFDGRFVFAVSSTGIYCRPSCPSRRPKRQNVRFYSVPEAAEAEGYRACLRCRPEDADVGDPRTSMVQSVCRIIDEDPANAPGLEALATATGVSAGHLQRTFKRIVGITPREYAEARRLALLKDDLRTKRTVTEAQFQAGFGSSSRLYERSSKRLGMTPATYRRGGAGARISFAITTCTMGHLLVASTERGICSVKLGDEEHELETQLRNEFAAGEIQRDDAGLAQWIAAVADMVEAGREIADLPLDVLATAFQWRVWQLLQEIPRGETRTYGELAKTLRSPRAARAVARACATNPVALVIPCHRVVPERGDAGGYRWGPHRKERLLEREQRAAAFDGRYDLEREIGAGGMAKVYSARDLKHGRKVAVKVLNADVAAGLETKRFLREIEIAAQLQHPNIVPVFDSGELPGVLYYVMPLIEGGSLRSRLAADGPLGWQEATQIATEVAAALDCAHAAGVVHRDIKPENILFSNGRAMVADFGIARVPRESSDQAITASGLAIGTPWYMSPEQALGEAAVDHRTDVYALGCVLYEMLTGEPPFAGTDVRAVLSQIVTAPAPRIQSRAVPKRVRQAVARALSKTANDRYATVKRFTAALTSEDSTANRMLAVTASLLSLLPL